MIPKKLHFIWIGDEAKMPEACIQTWIDRHPDYEIKIWGNADIYNLDRRWRNPYKIQDMLDKKDYAGASDIMRYEILYNEGGIYIDADSFCVKPLEDWILDCTAFTCWEQEHVRNNLLSNGFIGGVPQAEIWRLCMFEIAKRDCAEDKLAWMITGPLMLTEIYFQHMPDLTVYPSNFFMPEHHTGYTSNVTGHRFATHLWGSEIGYDNMDETMEKKNDS